MSQTVPQFSIIVPIYNTARELPRCVDSVMEQSFADYELILVDDGSTDQSGQLCDQYAETDERIICIHKVNGGLSDARNTGTRAAKGQYLLFLDSDDLWGSPHVLSELNEIIESEVQKPDLICFGVEIIDENGKREKTRLPGLLSDKDINKEKVVKHLVYSNQYISAAYVKAVRRNLIFENDIFFIDGIYSEDIEWSARLLVLCKTIAVCPQAFYKRIRRSEGSITSSIGINNILDIQESIENGIDFTRSHSEDEQMLVLYYEYWAYQYAMLFVLLSSIKYDKSYKQIIGWMKKYRWLLQYDHVKKVHSVRTLCRFLGVRGTVSVLGLFYRLR